MKVLKRISCVLLAVLVLCMPVIRTYKAHAEAIAASTIAAYAVLGTALTACGIMVAAHAAGSDVAVTDALAAAWDKTTDGIKNDIRNIKLAVGITGGVVAHWTSDKWHRFTNWVKETFNPATENSLPLPVNTSFADNVLVQTSLSLASAPFVDSFARSAISSFKYDLSTKHSSVVKFAYENTASQSIYALLVSGASVLFTSASYAAIYGNMNNMYKSISLFQPVVCGTLYIPIATSVYGSVTHDYSNSYNQRCGLNGWKLGADCGNASLVGKSIVMQDGILKVNGIRILGNWASIADYIGACLDAGVVIGIPLDDGTTHEQEDVINTGDSLPVSIDADYFPGTGASAAEDSLPDGIGYDIPIPVSTPYEGQDVYTKDVTDGSIDIDIDRVGDLTPADTRPRVRTDEGTTAGYATTAAYMTTAKSIEIPSEVADQTIAQPPPGGGGGEEEEEEDGNNLKLPALMLTKFPFCIPHDFKVAVEQLIADPAPPKFDFRLKIDSLHLNYTIPVDFSSFESVAYFVRWLISAFWVIILIRGTLRLINA